jgi:hypothetical protein
VREYLTPWTPGVKPLFTPFQGLATLALDVNRRGVEKRDIQVGEQVTAPEACGTIVLPAQVQRPDADGERPIIDEQQPHR